MQQQHMAFDGFAVACLHAACIGTCVLCPCRACRACRAIQASDSNGLTDYNLVLTAQVEGEISRRGAHHGELVH